MKKIIVAGAGHGGVTAAMNLARAGYAVTVYEKQKRENMGYDWVDCIIKDTFDKTGYIRPDDSNFGPMADQAYYNPKKSVRIVVETNPDSILGYIDRKFLINYIIDAAEEAGVKFVFGADIVCALNDGERVTGIKISKNGKEKDVFGDMIIDAAGIDSPVRSTLPEEFGVRNKAHKEERFFTWRGGFRKTDDFASDPTNTVYFDHCGRIGMDWAIDEGENIDILVGGFGSLSQEEIDEALEDFRKDYPIGEKPVSGGTYDCIPLGRALSVMVCNNYAAVGNSAFMTTPLSGSGLDMSMLCGKLLADVIIASGGDFSVRALWKYNYRVFKEHAEPQYNNVIVKNLMSELTADDMDFLFENRIFTAKEIGGGGNVKYSVQDILAKAGIIKKAQILPAFISFGKKSLILGRIRQAIPEGYNRDAVENWKDIYSKLR